MSHPMNCNLPNSSEPAIVFTAQAWQHFSDATEFNVLLPILSAIVTAVYTTYRHHPEEVAWDMRISLSSPPAFNDDSQWLLHVDHLCEGEQPEVLLISTAS